MVGLILQDHYSVLRLGDFPTLWSYFTGLITPLKNNRAHALSCIYKGKLDKMGNSRMQKVHGIDCVAVICMVQVYLSKPNQAGWNFCCKQMVGLILQDQYPALRLGDFPSLWSYFTG